MNSTNTFKSRLIACWNRLVSRLFIQDQRFSIDHTFKDHSYEHLASTLNAIPDLMFELDAEGRHLDFRVLKPELLVAPPEALLGNTVADVMPPDAAQTVMNALQETLRSGYSHGTHIYLPTPTGERWFEVSMAKKAPVPGEGVRVIALSRDITERKQELIEKEQRAYIDPLTELPNRLAMKECLLEEVRVNQAAGHWGVLLFIDLDKFKQLNDSKGHNHGDLLLKCVAQRLRAAVREEDKVIRWGGDEFLVLITNLDAGKKGAEEKAIQICEKITDKITLPYDLNGYTYRCCASIGVKIIDDFESPFEELIHQADSAMYTAKKNTEQSYAFYS